MARKDDPVFNVKFVQLVENQPCLWNYTHPGYSKKEEVQRAWQHVANEIRDTVRNSRERWRTIRSSFLRSLKLARTQTGRGKRKYYLSKYLQFLIPYTKSRACHKQPSASASATAPATATPTASQTNLNNGGGGGGMVLRKPSTSTTAATFLTSAGAGTQPMTRIGHMRLLGSQVSAGDEETKDSIGSRAADVLEEPEPVEEPDEREPEERLSEQQLQTDATPLRLQTIKVEPQQQQQQQCADKIVAAAAQHSLVPLPVTMAALRNNMNWFQHLHNSSSSSNSNNHNHNNSNNSLLPHHLATTPPPVASTPGPGQQQAPDADYSFLISLLPYLKEMSGKQNRRFRQKVVGLIDNVLDNLDA